MRKFTIIAVAILLIMTNSYAQFSTESDIRLRSEIGTTNSRAVRNRRVDMRYRPFFSYRLNEHLSFSTVLEIGDVGFGNVPEGGALGTDERIVQLKHLYMEITPPDFNIFDEHNITLGLQAYKDLHGLVFDDDVAGILYEGKIKDLEFGAGWFVPYDYGELLYGSETYSAGETVFSLDLSYDLKFGELELKPGFNNFLSFSNDYIDYGPNDSRQISTTGYWMSPYVTGRFRDLNFESQFVYQRHQVQEERLLNDQGPSVTPYSGFSAVAYSFKAGYKILEDLSTKMNILVKSGAPNRHKGGYEGYASYFDTELEVINPSRYSNGIYTYDPMSIDSHQFGYYGVFIPSLIIDYLLLDRKISVIDKIGLTGFFGMALSLEPVQNERRTEESKIFGVEYGFRSNIHIMEHLEVIPFFAMFHVGEAYLYGKLEDYTIQRNQFKLGTTLRVSF